MSQAKHLASRVSRLAFRASPATLLEPYDH